MPGWRRGAPRDYRELARPSGCGLLAKQRVVHEMRHDFCLFSQHTQDPEAPAALDVRGVEWED